MNIVYDLYYQVKRFYLKIVKKPILTLFVSIIISFLIILVLFKLNISEGDDITQLLILTIGQGFLTYYSSKQRYQNNFIIEVILSYLVENNEPMLDNLLGKLISGSVELNNLTPGDLFFKVLLEKAQTSDWEMKRRITEALPSLCDLNLSETTNIMNILRDDYDENRWKDDLRRRVVESLIMGEKGNPTPIYCRLKPIDLYNLLEVRENDQVFTFYAILEVLDEISSQSVFKKDTIRINEILEQIDTYACKKLPPEECESIINLKNLLNKRRGRKLEFLDYLKKINISDNKYNQVVYARHVADLGKWYPDETLRLIDKIITEDFHKYARRAMAREYVLVFLITVLRTKNEAKNIIIKLISDEDAIVMVTTFDKIEEINLVDQNFADEICEIISNCKNVDKVKKRLETFLRLKKSMEKNKKINLFKFGQGL